MTTIVFLRNGATRRIRTRAPQTAINIYTSNGWTIAQIIFA